MQEFYKDFDDIEKDYYDGMIITGAPVEQMPFEDVSYWEEVTTIFDWARTHVIFNGIRFSTTTRSGRISWDDARKESITKMCSFFRSSIAGKFFCKFNGIAIPLYLFFRSTNLNKIYDSVAYPRQDFFITTLLFLKGKNKFEEQTTDFLYNSS